MALELIVNVVLMIAAVFAFWYVGATMPKSPDSEMGAEQWPQMLLVLLIIAIAYNIFSYFKKNKKEDVKAAFVDFFPGIVRFVKSKLFIGMVLLVVMSLLYEPLGFIVTCPLFMISYGVLLGARKPLPLIISSLVITLVLYIGFSVFLSVMLPRGYVPFLRSAAFFLESIFGR
ncbi:hypothetical protein AGMMS50268_21480 [Spirochaetia bacterium]|nr:hypothetical protein AGMMS50268_21480 [Spirochaetia bacterium]